ncbi:TspO/MBR family protein [Vulgatibacter sp.]|uniref:TspO/MBR family protein n=1 Tax=Vulgatibacter sp. TaxID=1971226 RepID=UPI0035627AD5
MERWDVGAAVGIGGAVAGTALLGAVATRSGLGPEYRALEKPPWQPPAAAFGPVWTVLYGMMAWSAWRVWRAPPSRARRRALGLWSAQLALNAAWSPLFFGLRRPGLALADIGLLQPTLVACTAATARVDRRAGLLLVPYLAWTTFAAALNASIVRRNRRRLRLARRLGLRRLYH